MIIWNGMGFLVAVIVFGFSFIANLITNNVAGNDKYWEAHQWTFGLSLIASSIVCWFVGRYLATRKAKVYIEKDTGKEIVSESNHALFFIKIHL